MHIIASVAINDEESGLHHAWDAWLEKIALHEPVGRHGHNDSENSDAGTTISVTTE